MTKHEVGKPWKCFNGKIVERLFIVDDDLRPVRSRVHPDAGFGGGSAMTRVVIGGHDEPCVEECGNEMDIPP